MVPPRNPDREKARGNQRVRERAAVYYSPPGTVTFTYDGTTGSSSITYMKLYPEKEGPMSDSVRMRVVLDFPVDPTTASERVLKAIAKEMRNNAQIILVKEHEVTLTDHVEAVDVHVHRSTPSEACAHCVQELAMDARE